MVRVVATVAVAATVACADLGGDAPLADMDGAITAFETETTAPAAPAPSPASDAPTATMPPPAADPSTPTLPPTSTPTAMEGTPVPLRVESRVDDVPTAAFRETVEAILTDDRGWQRAGFRFVFDDPDAPFHLVLAEGPEVDELCLPLDTYGLYSCQNGPVVALNADRWRTATPEWTSTLEEYRVMLVNHEVGHLLHLHHPLPQCPGEGLPAPVMAQQSTELGVCTANPWPLQWEVDLAAEQREPLAPPADHDTRDHQPSPPPATE